jgi:hypothetical protein
MTIEVQGQHAGDAVFVYNDDKRRLPLTVIPGLARDAEMREIPGKDPGAAYGGHWYDRDALGTLRRDLEANALQQLDTCTEDGCEEAEHPDPTQARPRCARHLKDPQ